MTAGVTESIFTAWPVVAATITVTGGFVVVILTHYFTRKREHQMFEVKRLREKEDAEEKRLTEFRFICSTLIFRLEAFAQGCADVAQDSGKSNGGKFTANYLYPGISFSDVDGDWKSLPSRLLYHVLELPVLCQDAVLRIDGETEHCIFNPLEHHSAWEVRQKYYAELGTRACELAIELRRLSGFPESDLASGEWSAMSVLSKVILRENDKKRREESDTEI
ncbi:hypothetical protein [Erwinia rhapontici]|uniref:hypothetical protein n=1 Tax=Erwinia rhapontici TaxID=55212 RepID=UPI0013311890|nr:hypothetical protein [Erwinia rhapontici]MBP2157442.1 hypothetical protein [Erwinia rhapontici]